MYYPPFVELCTRFLYDKFVPAKKKKKKHSKVPISKLKQIIKQFPIEKGDSLMVHSSFGRIDATPDEVISYLRSLIGDSGTLLMPTHPALVEENKKYIYDIKRTQSKVGYLTEYFRKMDGTVRSKHPYATIAAQGPKAEEYLDKNLGPNKLPHGIGSSYHKFCLDNGKVLCLGVTAIGRATVKHVAEEVLDSEYILNNIFDTRKVKVYDDEYYLGEYVVRERTNDLIPFLAKSRLDRDWRNEGITINKSVDGVPVDYLDAKLCFEWMVSKAKKGYIMYPYAKYHPHYKNTKF